MVSSGAMVEPASLAPLASCRLLAMAGAKCERGFETLRGTSNVVADVLRESRTDDALPDAQRTQHFAHRSVGQRQIDEGRECRPVQGAVGAGRTFGARVRTPAGGRLYIDWCAQRLGRIERRGHGRTRRAGSTV